MKQMQTREVEIGDIRFYIRPFPAFKAANISAEIVSLVAPLLSGVASLVPDNKDNSKEKKSLLDIDIENASPVISKAFSALSGDELERVLKNLLVSDGNVSYEMSGEKVRLLTEDDANEIFCEELQDMFILAFEVIRTNYNGFFRRLGNRFGPAIAGLMKAVPSTPNSENLTSAGSVNLS